MSAEEKPADLSIQEANNPDGDTPAGLPATIQNRRCHPRYAVDEDSILLLVSHGSQIESHILDLSLEGCRLQTREPYTAGTGTRVEITFKVNGIAFRFVGVVQWVRGQRQVGIRFVEMISRRREQLAEVICEMEAAAKAAKEAAERDAALKEAQERIDQETPLEAGRKAEVPAEKPAASEASEIAEREARERAETRESSRRAKLALQARALPIQGQARAIPNRRAQVRHEVDTTATILLIKSGSRLSGHILDLSAAGCRIRSDERFPVGIYTRVEAEFNLEGMPFLLGGVIQSIHDPHNVGIRFLDVSQRKREQVDQLIAEIEHARTRPAAPGDEGAEPRS